MSPDLTIFLELEPELALVNLGRRIEGLFTPDDIRLQTEIYSKELAKLPKDKVGIIDATKPEDVIAAEALELVGKIL